MMALYSSPSSLDCHRVRFVLAEKGINVEIIDITTEPGAASDMAELNPYNEAPTLVDRDLVLYGAAVINDYLDERYPHPPLMPVDPVSRARLRLTRYRIMRDWFTLAGDIEKGTAKQAEKARKLLRESLTAANEIFTIAPFVMSEELSLVDCSLGPLLWRLPHYNVQLVKNAAAVQAYAERVFQRPSFQASLTPTEQQMIAADG